MYERTALSCFLCRGGYFRFWWYSGSPYNRVRCRGHVRSRCCCNIFAGLWLCGY